LLQLRRIGCDASGEETDGVLLFVEKRDALANDVAKIFFAIRRDGSLWRSAMLLWRLEMSKLTTEMMFDSQPSVK
jgi:hypothetical protein